MGTPTPPTLTFEAEVWGLASKTGLFEAEVGGLETQNFGSAFLWMLFCFPYGAGRAVLVGSTEQLKRKW